MPFGPETSLLEPYRQEIRHMDKYLDTKVILVIVYSCDKLGENLIYSPIR